MAKAREASRGERRQRRTAEEARAAILDAAERQLVAGGPAALRLQQVATDVGVSHPTVLHHFGSREGLVEAVVTRALAALQADVLDALGKVPPGEEGVAQLLERVHAALDRQGHGRALAWLALAGLTGPGGAAGELGLRRVADATHALRKERHGPKVPPVEDTLFTLLLVFFSLFAESVAGEVLLRGAGLDPAKAGPRYRRWLAERVEEMLSRR